MAASAGLAMVTIGLVGCTSDGDRDEPVAFATSNDEDPAGSATSAPLLGREISASMVLPIQAYIPTDEEYITLQRAESAITTACMAAQGFDYHPPAPAAGLSDQMHRRYNWVYDKETAAEHGYHWVPTGPEEEPAEVLDPGAREALMGDEMGDEPGGCLGEAYDHLTDGLERHDGAGLNLPYLVMEVKSESYHRSQEDPRVLDVFREWSSCMAEGGYTATKPLDDRLFQDFDFGLPEPSQAEIDQALWNVECMERTDLLSVWFDVESEIQRELIDKHAEAFAQIAEENEEMMRRAAAALEDAGN
jgi:hypothetical protein